MDEINTNTIMGGFFTKAETASETRPDGKIYSCISCGMYKNCVSPRMMSYGEFHKKILIVGESPSDLDDKRGKMWQGKDGKILQRTLEDFGIDLFEDCLSINACNCKVTTPEGDYRIPTNYEVECCRKFKLKIINDYNPSLIIILGNSALFSLIGHRWKKDLDKINKWRGFCIPDQGFKSWVCPTFHPREIENAKESHMESIWRVDLQNALEKLDEEFPVYREPVIKIIQDLSVLDDIPDGAEVAFDYETTGLKPHAPGHEVICCSVAVSEDLVYVFMIPKDRKKRRPFIRLITNPEIYKVAQNMKYEDAWTFVLFGVEVAGWVWDTMLASHILDNRPGVSGLKFQTYVQFGIVDYDSEVNPYLRSNDEKNANAINRIHELLVKPGGKEKLLKYCGYDSINEIRLSVLQRRIILPPPF